MSDIQFDEEQITSPYIPANRPPSGLSAIIINTGLAKTAKQANLVMIGLIIILLVITFFSLRSLRVDSTTQVISTDLGPGFNPDTGLPVVE